MHDRERICRGEALRAIVGHEIALMASTMSMSSFSSFAICIAVVIPHEIMRLVIRGGGATTVSRVDEGTLLATPHRQTLFGGSKPTRPTATFWPPPIAARVADLPALPAPVGRQRHFATRPFALTSRCPPL